MVRCNNCVIKITGWSSHKKPHIFSIKPLSVHWWWSYVVGICLSPCESASHHYLDCLDHSNHSWNVLSGAVSSLCFTLVTDRCTWLKRVFLVPIYWWTGSFNKSQRAFKNKFEGGRHHKNAVFRQGEEIRDTGKPSGLVCRGPESLSDQMV